jgi:hypothetical protein
MGEAVISQASAGNGWARICLKDGRRLLVTKGIHEVKVSQISPLPAPEDCVWRQDYPAGHALNVAYRRIVMLLTAGRSIAQIAAHENLPEILHSNRVAAISADLGQGILGAVVAIVQGLQKDPLNIGSLGSSTKAFTRCGAEAAFEYMAFLVHATGRVALATLGRDGRDEFMEALAEAMIAGFTLALYHRRMDAVEREVVVECLAERLADREAEYEGCAGMDRPGGGLGETLLWELGTRTAALLGRTNEIAFIDATDDQMTACLDGLHLAARFLPLLEPYGGTPQAPVSLRPQEHHPRSPGGSVREATGYHESANELRREPTVLPGQ